MPEKAARHHVGGRGLRAGKVAYAEISLGTLPKIRRSYLFQEYFETTNMTVSQI